MKEQINHIDIKSYQEFVERYNALPVAKREDWSENNEEFPYDEPTLYSKTDDNGETIEEYILEVIPEWAESSDSIAIFGGIEDAQIYYGLDKEPTDIYKKNLKITVIYHNFKSLYSDELEYQDSELADTFMSRMKAIGKDSYFDKLTVNLKCIPKEA